MNKKYTLHLGDCIEVMRAMPDNSIDAIVTDPPYGLEFMGKEWDGADGFRRSLNKADMGRENVFGRASRTSPEYRAGHLFQEWTEAWAAEALRVLKPGGHLLAFSGSRTYHRMACAIEDAGFDVRDQIMWVYGSGFPKSRNIAAQDFDGEDAKRWKGWGTALKPAHEPICVARKPLVGTVAANVLTHGTGALNIDGCRVHSHDSAGYVYTTQHMAPGADQNKTGKMHQKGVEFQGVTKNGRWPANLIHDGSDEVLAAFPDAAGQQGVVTGDEPTAQGFSGAVFGAPGAERRQSAARFFYCAKASRADRNDGLPDPGRQFKRGTTLHQIENAAGAGGLLGNTHPTVKPTELMAYLCRLVTPPGGLVLDPFMGSGSTGKAAMREGFRFVGVDMTPEYVDIARARIAAQLERSEPANKPATQMGLFSESE